MDNQTLNFQPLHIGFFLLKDFIQKHSTCRHFCFREITVFCMSILTVRNFHRKYEKFKFSPVSTSPFTKTRGFISSVRVGIENVLLVDSFLLRELSICVPCITVFTVKNFQEVLIFLLRSIFKLAILGL